MSETVYDVIIIGGGPAGLSAAIYAGRSNLKTLLIEKGMAGGLIFQVSEIENYPGGIKGESGAEFSLRLSEHADAFHCERVTDEVQAVELDGEEKVITCINGEYRGRTVIVATGNMPIKLGVPGETEFAGRGVSYCATCDGPFFTDLDIYVVGGGDSAVQEALHLAKFAKRVIIIHRRDQLRAAASIQDKAHHCKNIEWMLETVVQEIKGGDLLDCLVVKNLKTGETSEIHADEADGTMGLFVFVGMAPQTTVFNGKLEMSDGYILTDVDMKTNIPGVFAAGDVRAKTLRQVVTATADGAIAAISAERYLE